MRITELVNNLEIGGAERMVSNLALGLQSRGHALNVICLRSAGPLAQSLRESGIEVCALEKGEGFSFKAVRTVAEYLRSSRTDVIHTHNPLVHHYGAVSARLAGVPVVVNTFHGPGNLTGFGRTQTIFDVSCLWSDRVVPCCEAVGAHLRHVTLVARRKLTVIPNGVPLERFRAIRPHAAENDFVIGSVGRLVPVKDHHSLLKAIAMIRREEPRVRLEILGDGPLRSALEQTARDLGIGSNVAFHGSSLDVPGFLSRLDTFVLCSLSEGLPLTLVEAMAAGLPVVGTTVGAIPELVGAAGCGWLCSPGDPGQLAAALLKSLRCDARAQRGLRGRDYVLEHHSVESMTNAYEQLFGELLEARRGAMSSNRITDRDSQGFCVSPERQSRKQ
jgi:glycosyltransferase involved in cell wall biosynthesis